MDGTDFSMLLRKRLNYVENDTYNLGMEKKKDESSKYIFCLQTFFRFCSLLVTSSLGRKN